MPQPRLFTDEQEADALTRYREANGRRGVIAEISRDLGISWQGTKYLLQRAEARETKSKVPRETWEEGALE